MSRRPLPERLLHGKSIPNFNISRAEAMDGTAQIAAARSKNRPSRAILRTGKASADDGLPPKIDHPRSSHPLKRPEAEPQSLGGGCPFVFALRHASRKNSHADGYHHGLPFPNALKTHLKVRESLESLCKWWGIQLLTVATSQSNRCT